jgi:2-polyprenyl-3-methyl-5-hydroxy-6-metoxy-1,4-benzoquinol methylase
MFNLKASYPYQPEINQVAFELISKAIKNKKDIKNILDVGCGYGLLSKQLKRAYPKLNLYGIEHAKEASQSSQKILKLLRCDIENIPLIKSQLKTQKFDVIIFSDVLEHLYDPVLVDGPVEHEVVLLGGHQHCRVVVRVADLLYLMDLQE